MAKTGAGGMSDRIEMAPGAAQIDAGIVARALRLSTQELRTGMAEGRITSLFERGTDADAGRIRLTFYSETRRVRVTATDDGTILSCTGADMRRGPARKTPE